MLVRGFEIESTSRPGVKYQVLVYQDKIVCTCPHYQLRHVECKHIKAIRRKYGHKQVKENQPAGAGSESPTVPSDDQGHVEPQNPVPSGELRRSSIDDGNPATIQPRNESDGSAGPSDSSEAPEAGVGTPNAGADLPRPAQGSNQAPPRHDQGVRHTHDDGKLRCTHVFDEVQCFGEANITGGWCQYCKDNYSTYPAAKPNIAFEERRRAMAAKAKQELKNSPPEVDVDSAVELFGHIPPAPKVQAENEELDF